MFGKMNPLRHLFSKLRRLLASRGRSVDDIDDLMQEAYLRLQVYCRDRTVENTEAFMVRTVLNLSAEQGRQSRPMQSLTDKPDEFVLVDPAPSPDEIYAGQQRLRRMKAGIEQLSPRSRETLLLHRLDGLSYAQIAQQLGISTSMVEKHIARASFFLRDWMARSPE